MDIDIAVLIKNFGHKLDWDKVSEASLNYGLSVFVRVVLKLTEGSTGIEIPDQVMAKFESEKKGIGERLFYYITSRRRGISGLSYLVHLGIARGIQKKVSIIYRTLFPPAWVLAKGHQGQSIKSPIKFYLHRCREILSGVLLFPLQKLRNICLIIMLCMSALTGSSVYASEHSLNVTAIEKNATYTMESGVPEYLIAPKDLIEIRIWRGFEEKKHEVLVKPDGFITVAYVTIKVTDKTARQAEAILKDALLEYIKKPKVEVSIKEYNGRRVTLLGAIKSQSRQPSGPGMYTLKGKTTISQLIIEAGGFT